ncbi:heavy metal translocating P-type ATPase [Levilactobacillus bambusae]|uniref:Cd(2+)-exporting ATPase n=1 Tax=Levilactobacillus bambusae TaxID=2024736 RepID=A0A2V1N1I1_9LACO|nr:cation-translocating P-type ATPase [Levilactobacillus bambusae]PWG00883.1 heavy metal translocating P-type ATPase [Levilactobacillus bambusae]
MLRWITQHKTQLMISGVFLLGISFSGYLAGWSQLTAICLIAAGIIGELPIAVSAYEALRVRVISIELLVSIAVIGAFIIGEYHEAAIVTLLFLFGGWLEKATLGKTRAAIKELTELAPQTAILLTDQEQHEVDIEEVEVGDLLLVKAGQRVPVDGEITSGTGLLDQSAVTGESDLVKRTQGDSVFAGTTLDNGQLTIVANRVGEETTFGKIIELVEEAQDGQSDQQQFIDRFATYYTPAVLILGILVGVITKNLNLAITILVLGCPGALVIGVPIAMVAGIGNGAKNGILVKGGAEMDRFRQVTTFIFDKTGTLTEGHPSVVNVDRLVPNADDGFKLAATLEQTATHPLGQALIEAFQPVNQEVNQVNVVKGAGITGEVGTEQVAIGNQRLMTQLKITVPQRQIDLSRDWQKNGETVVWVAINGQVTGLMGITDPIRPDVPQALAALRRLGATNLVMMTGDNQATAGAIANQLGIEEVHAGLLPEDKERLVSQYQESGQHVAFVGDGINDSPSLARADVGIAIGSGTDVAIETSGIVLMAANFNSLVHAYGLSQKTMANVTENIGIAVGTVGLLLVGLLIGVVNMASGMFIHELSILLVILNSMRLLKYQTKLDDYQGRSRQLPVQSKVTELKGRKN